MLLLSHVVEVEDAVSIAAVVYNRSCRGTVECNQLDTTRGEVATEKILKSHTSSPLVSFMRLSFECVVFVPLRSVAFAATCEDLCEIT